MSRKGDAISEPRHALVAALEAGQTGCLVGRGADGAFYSVYVMLGEVLAAHVDDDDARIVARVAAAGTVPDGAVETLRAHAEGGGSLGDSLFDVLPEETVLSLLYERFRENLLGFLATRELEDFEPMDAVFTDNIQVGHDSRALVEELVAARARVAALRAQTEMVVAPGAAPPESELERILLARCEGRSRLVDLVGRSPAEPGRTYEIVQDMLDRGTFLGVVPTPRKRAERSQPPVVQPEPPAAPAPEPPPAPEPLPAPPVAAEPPPVEAEIFDEPPTESVETEPLAEEPGGLSADDLPEEPTVDEPLRKAFFQGGDASEEDDLAAFQDYDTSRGGGSFMAERELLDRVDLDVAPAGGASGAADTDTLIEMEEADAKEAAKGAVSLNFSGPKLHEDDIYRKLEVTNEVLATIAAAIEAAEGRGSGQARLQLLVEGTSVPLAPLFKNVELSNDGQLPPAQIVKNLRKRPAGEHRRLLNRGLSDLIERALSVAYESLDEPSLEAMLERIAGYQQRLGV